MSCTGTWPWVGARCLSFDSGLAGALHVTEAGTSGPGLSSGANGNEVVAVSQVVAVLLEYLLTGAGGSRTLAQCQGTCRTPVTVGVASPSSGDFDFAGPNTDGVMLGCALAGVVLDDDSPFAPILGEIGLERVCDADWLKFESGVCTSSESGVASVASLAAVAFSP